MATTISPGGGRDTLDAADGDDVLDGVGNNDLALTADSDPTADDVLTDDVFQDDFAFDLSWANV